MPKPFGKIALSLSGGGVRAVGYHTGALALLDSIHYEPTVGADEVSLLSDVAMVSTVSGGTLVGLGYASSVADGDDFGHFYARLRQGLADNYFFVQHLLQYLNTPHVPGPAGRRYLIAAYADVLKNAFDFFGDRRFDHITDGIPGTHLEETIFNSLETYFGEPFRFQHGTLGAISGNLRVPLPEEEAKQALLSDILTASSTLPGAFAPIVFPDDFHWPEDVDPEPWHHPRPVCTTVQDEIEAAFQTNGGHTGTRTVTLIDGGVYDNQGMSAIVSWLSGAMQALSGTSFDRLIRWPAISPDDIEETIKARRAVLANLGAPRERSAPRRGYWARLSSRGEARELPRPLKVQGDEESDHDYGLFFVSDAPDFDGADPIYEVANERRTGMGTRLKTIARVAIIGSILGALALLIIGYRLIFGPPFLASPTLVDYLLLGIALGVLAVAVVVTVLFLFRSRKALRSCKNANGSIWPGIRRLRVRDIWNMGQLRGGSVAAVLLNIMPNRIRNLGIDALLTDPLIFEETVVLSEMDDFMKEAPIGLPAWLVPSQAMVDLATEMAAMEVRFWLTDEEFRQLVAVGQCTTCYNLLVQLMLRKTLYPRTGPKDDPVFTISRHQQVFDQCRAAWEELLADPMARVP